MLEQRDTNPRLPLTTNSVHWGGDLDSLRQSIQTNIIGVDLKVLEQPSRPLEGYLAHIEAEDMQVSFIRYGASVEVNCQQDAVYCFVIPYGGECCVRHNMPIVSYDERIKLLPPLSELDMSYSGNCGHLVIRFRQNALHTNLFDPIFCEENYLCNALNGIYQTSTRFLQDCEYAENYSEISRLHTQLKQEIYEVAAHRNHDKRPARVSYQAVSTAVNFIKEHPTWEYSLQDLTNLTQTSPRTLYSQFRRSTGTSPYRFYLNQRLRMARLDLLRFGRSQSITAIASHNGFSHLGRFANQYRMYFGELPNQTLMRNSRLTR